MEKDKMTIEEKTKIFDDLIEAKKGLSEKYMKAIDKLNGEISDRVLADLTFEAARFLECDQLKAMKKSILDHSLGDEYADRAFGVEAY